MQSLHDNRWLRTVRTGEPGALNWAIKSFLDLNLDAKTKWGDIASCMKIDFVWGVKNGPFLNRYRKCKTNLEFPNHWYLMMTRRGLSPSWQLLFFSCRAGSFVAEPFVSQSQLCRWWVWENWGFLIGGFREADQSRLLAKFHNLHWSAVQTSWVNFLLA